MTDARLDIVIPGPDAALCCDCGCVFLSTGRTTCAGCGSRVFVAVNQIGVRRPEGLRLVTPLPAHATNASEAASVEAMAGSGMVTE